MKCLGIESTAHTFGAAVVEDGKTLSNEKSLYTTKKGGLIPAKLAGHHLDCCKEVIERALYTAGCEMKDIDVIAFSQSPGIGHALRIGCSAAKSLALLHDKPLVGVNHCIAHLEIGRHLGKSDDPVLVLTSGANMQIIAYDGGRYRIFGETLDTGIGNFLDTFGRDIGLGFPAGPQIEKLAKKGKYVELPYVVKGMDLSFGGIQTKLKQLVEDGVSKEDLCFSSQETVFAMIVEVAERAMAYTGKEELILGGGVACNKRLQEMCRVMCKDRGARFFCPENQFLVDNAAMIAWTGILMHEAGVVLKPEDADIKPYLRTDEVEIKWR